MASKGSKSDAVKPPIVPAPKPAVPLVAKTAAEPVKAPLVPVPFAKPVAAAPVPVVPTPAIVAKAPAAAPMPAPVTELAVATPAVPVSEVATPVAPAPVITPQAPAPALTQKEDIMEATFNAATDKTQAMFADVNDRAKTAMEKGSKMFEDMGAFSKGNMEAMVESSKIAAKGAEEVARYTTDYARATVEKANAAAKQFASVKSPTELFKLQGDFAKEAMDSMMAETAKFTENYLKLLGEIAQPLSNRVAVAAEKMKIAA